MPRNATLAAAGVVPAGFGPVLARFAHDLNNCLARINGKAELALMLDEPERFRPALEEALAAGQRASVLVADLQRWLAWAGLRGGVEEPVPLVDAVTVAIRLGGASGDGTTPRVRSRGGAARIDPAVAARLVTALGSLLPRLLELAPAADALSLETGGGENGWRVDAVVPGLRLAPEERAALGRAARLGESMPDPWDTVARELDAVGASLLLEGDRIRLESSPAANV